MDCSTALEILESAAPSGHDLQAPEFADAARHVESCADCAETFEARQLFDRRIGESLWNVPVPPGLKAQLFEAVAAESQGPERPATGQAAPRPVKRNSRVTRRTWLTAVASTAVAVLLAVVGWQVFFGPTAPTIVLEQLLMGEDERLLAAVADPQKRSAFNVTFSAEVPFEWNRRGLLVSENPQGFAVDGEPQRMLALFDFRLKQRNRSVDGVLVVMPAEWVRDLPTAQSFAAASAAGTPPRVGGFTPVAWTDGELVYVCFVEAGGLETLSDALRSSPA